MKSKIFLADKVIVMVTLAYVTYLSVLSAMGILPVEKQLVIIDSGWKIILPFTVSYWWNLILAPVVIVFWRYLKMSENIIGKDPESSNRRIEYKYRIRRSVIMINTICGMVSLGIMVSSAFLFQIGPKIGLSSVEDKFSPVTALTNGIILGIISYFITGISFGFDALSLGRFDAMRLGKEEEMKDKYSIMFTLTSRIGLIKTFPMLLGMVVTYNLFMLRYNYERRRKK